MSTPAVATSSTATSATFATSTATSASILDVMTDEELFKPFFKRKTWLHWRVFLGALFGLAPRHASWPGLYERFTQRKGGWPSSSGQQFEEAWVIAGRRSGKSRISAFIATFLACFRDYSDVLAPGEQGIVMVIAADRSQARVVFKYIRAFLNSVSFLKRLIVSDKAEALELSNGITITVQTASYRSTRGYTVVACICDEIAFWRDDESANPDTEILDAVRPGMATVPGALLIAISSPYARRGALWEAYESYFGRDDPNVLVWQAETREMNPNVAQRVVDRAYERDATAAETEYGGSFRRDIESYVNRDVLRACVDVGRAESLRSPKHRYAAFVDPSGGTVDAMTLAVGHVEGGGAGVRGSQQTFVVDCVRCAEPKVDAPLSPTSVVAEFASVLKSYGVTRVVGDRYGGEWPREQFRENGITYEVAPKAKSDLYVELLPLLNSRSARLVDNKKLFVELAMLERRSGRGKDQIDHPPKGHDDVANAVAGVLAGLVLKKRLGATW